MTHHRTRFSYSLCASSALLGLVLSTSTVAAQSIVGNSMASPSVMQQAETLEQQGNLIEALKAYQALAQSEEHAIEANLSLARVFSALNRHSEALSAMKEAHKRASDNPEVIVKLAHALIDNGETKEAVLLLDGLNAMQPDNVDAYNIKAVAFDKSGNHLAAQELYQKALSLSPQSISVRNNLAMSYILNNQLDDAIALLESLSKSDPSSSVIRQNLALAYGVKGDMKKALELNLKDMPYTKAQENLKFYKEYAAKLQAKQSDETILELMPPSGPAPIPEPVAVVAEPIFPAAIPPKNEVTSPEQAAPEVQGTKKPPTLFGIELKGDFPSAYKKKL